MAIITIPSVDEQLAIAINSKAKAHESIAIGADQKFACIFIPLAPAVTSANYSALKTSIEAVTGIQVGVRLLIDGQTPLTISEGRDLRLKLSAQIRMDPIPAPPEA